MNLCDREFRGTAQAIHLHRRTTKAIASYPPRRRNLLDRVQLEIRKGLAIITINRPEKRNALNQELRSDLYRILIHVDSRDDVRVAIITGVGDAFVAGADIAAMKEYQPEDARKASEHGCEVFSFIENMRIPVIAAINGWALGGGCELAFACDIRICSDNAMLGQPEVGVGIFPGYGATVRLPRLVGIGRAKEMIYTGRPMGAAEAERIGLVNMVVSRDNLMDEAIKLAKKISEGPAAIGFAKKAINKSSTMSMRLFVMAVAIQSFSLVEWTPGDNPHP